MLVDLEAIVEKHVSVVRISSVKLAPLLKRNLTLTEIEDVINAAIEKLTQETEFTIRDALEGYTSAPEVMP